MTATRAFPTTFDEAWQDFTTQTATQDETAHSIDRQMREAKSSYMAFLIPVTGTQIIEATRPAREALTAAGIEHVLPSHYFHITVLGISLESALKAGSIARIMDRTSRALREVQPVRLTLRGVNSFPTAAFVEVHDEDNRLTTIRDTLVGALGQLKMPGFGPSALSSEDAPAEGEAKVDNADAVNAPPYLPHMSLCYYKDAYPVARVAPVLEPYRTMEMGTMRVNYIQLAAMPYSEYDRFPEITRIADLLIG